MIGYVVLFVAGGGVGLIVGALLNAAKARPVFAPAAVEWVCTKCGQVTPPERGERRQLNLEVWDTYGHMIAQWPVGEGEQLGSRAIGPWVEAEVGAVVASHNAASAVLAAKLKLV